MHDHRQATEARLERAVVQRVRPAVHSGATALQVAAWHAPGEPVPVAEGLAAPYEEFAVGTPWGLPWGTTWFRLRGQVPAEWAGRPVEVVFDLGTVADHVGFQAEGLVYTPAGEPVKSINPLSTWIPVPAGTQEFEFFVEAASNPDVLGGGGHAFDPTPLGDVLTAPQQPLYVLARADVCVRETEVAELLADLEVLGGLMLELPPEDARRWELLRGIDRALDALDPHDVAGSAARTRSVLAPLFAAKARASAHRVSAVGHAHIDSAWLWPLRETVRKVARTTANVTQLMDVHPSFVYAMSSAQQFAWIAEHRPEVHEKVRRRIAEGRFVPVGSMWVESDTNMVGSEAMVRQFVEGKGYFLREYGVDTQEAWLPDSFGYSAALPQIMKLAGVRWFLTQKISWNADNKFPHHTFDWEGIDGTRIFTHFPPVDTYNSELSARELAHAARNFQEKGRAHWSLVPFGWGDGGGGPTREMLQRADRLGSLDGSTRVSLHSPEQFFTTAEADYPDRPVWSGELYLELHRGTYTSQAKTKQGNRRNEHLLREAELWAATAAVRTGAQYPAARLQELWRTVLLHQFHDILPGSSIAWVHREAAATHARVSAELEELVAGSLRALAGEGSQRLVANAAPHARDGVPALGLAVAETAGAPVSTTSDGADTVLDNGLLRVRVDAGGNVVSVLDLLEDREVLLPGTSAGLLQLHRDTPNRWDAWDVDAHYRNVVRDLTDAESVVVHPDDGDPGRGASVVVTRSTGASTLVQTVRLPRGEARLAYSLDVDWHDREALLKAAFGLDVHADRSASEIQFGHVFRATHENTSWDASRFEICAHRWVHVGEAGYGAAVTNSATYGHDVTRSAVEGGRPGTTVRLSLLRAPLSPDPETDQGSHHLEYSLVVGAQITDAVREGYRQNLAPRVVQGAGPVEPLVAVEDGGVVVEAVKLAEDGSGDVVVRLYEALGGRVRTTVRWGFPVGSVTEVDLLERPLEQGATTVRDGGATLTLRPFQILTLRLTRA
ncbi:alpha-mannosidase [Kineococcus rhizosphaerae]|uniref:Alpha-mannosidase n=1 Tax=Kineococcus rhizosphaerae TaxID=559628 RepID=A0A2T0R0N2_9ACTN|nr:glycoside hydrolase family 38 C-terminal domain-containing protein [Kineococcus rhizosphaerae]PRY12839.1 alpha-mannosidase [Kineococcus rhizosphaerae]